ncbi:MAG: prolipoprotein diacylglyceryl transferase [Endomicrobiales bacterium]|nr:prolipoprotein diacylglyceryl transferase [Endomicrobiales bacterium]
MFPSILKIGPFAIRTYGVLVALGLFAALEYVVLRSKKHGIPENRIIDLVLYTIISGLVGARLFYVLLNLKFYFSRPWDALKIWEGGLVYYGGFLFGAAAVIYYVRRHEELDFWMMADLMAPALALAHFFGRLGCFFAGCCYGTPTSLPWAVKFTNPECLAPLGVWRHPVQLYEAAVNLSIFFLLHKYDTGRHPKGFVLAAYLGAYGVARFVLEFFRGDDRGGTLLAMSPGQLLSIALVLSSAALFFLRKNEDKG